MFCSWLLLMLLCLPLMCSWFDNLFGGGGALHHSAGGGDVLVHHPQVWLSLLFSSPPVAQAGREGDSIVCGVCKRGPWQCAWWYMRMVAYANVQDAGAHRSGGRGEQVAAYHHRSGLHANYQVSFFFCYLLVLCRRRMLPSAPM